MRRELLILVIIWLCSFIAGSLVLYFYFDFELVRGELVQIAILAFLFGVNYFYLFYVLYKFNETAAIIFVAVSLVSFVIATLVYRRYFRDIDPRLPAIHLLGALMITTVVVHVVRKRRASR